MKYTHHDIMYAVKCLSRNASAPSSKYLQGIKYLNRYLYVCPHHTIIYLAGLDSNTTNELRQEFPPGDLHYQNISNDLVAFWYGGEVRAPNDKLSIDWVILYLFGVYVNWLAKNKPPYAAHHIESEVCTFYLATNMVQWLGPIL